MRDKSQREEKMLRSIGCVCALYGAAVLCMLGLRHVFNYFFFGMGLCLIWLSRWNTLTARWNRKLRKAFMAACLTGLLLFAGTEIKILSAGFKGAEKQADYLLLLGSQVRESGPSYDYWVRLKAAYEYLSENPETKVIACGGKGESEPMSEAECAYRYLKQWGIEESRIIKEEKSRNTFENMANAAEILKDKRSSKIVIVSACYHLCRAEYLAHKAGFTDISLKGSVGRYLLIPHYYTREFFAYWKDVLVHGQ